MAGSEGLNLIIERILDIVKPLSAHRYKFPKPAIALFPAFICTLDYSEDEPVEYDVTIGHGTTRYKLQLVFALGKGDDESAHVRLNDFVTYPGTKSIKELLENADPTLGGAAMSFIVGNAVKLGTQELAGSFYLGGRIGIEVDA